MQNFDVAFIVSTNKLLYKPYICGALKHQETHLTSS